MRVLEAEIGRDLYCEIFDAVDPTAGPIARVKLPECISWGSHATWALVS